MNKRNLDVVTLAANEAEGNGSSDMANGFCWGSEHSASLAVCRVQAAIHMRSNTSLASGQQFDTIECNALQTTNLFFHILLS